MFFVLRSLQDTDSCHNDADDRDHNTYNPNKYSEHLFPFRIYRAYVSPPDIPEALIAWAMAKGEPLTRFGSTRNIITNICSFRKEVLRSYGI